MYDPKGKEKEAHSNMNVLRAKLAAKRECVLAKLPPCEESLKQHVRRAAWQTRIWISSHIAKPDLGSPLEYGWKREGEKLVPVYYEGLSASEVMQDLLCRGILVVHVLTHALVERTAWPVWNCVPVMVMMFVKI